MQGRHTGPIALKSGGTDVAVFVFEQKPTVMLQMRNRLSEFLIAASRLSRSGMEISMNKIILASGSPRRRELLEQIGIPFEVVTSNAAEVTSAVQPDEIVKELSKIKAEAVAQICKEKGESYRDVVILGADTIVYHNGKVLGKPKSEEDAYLMIESLAGKEHFDIYWSYNTDTEEADLFC